MVDAPTTFNEIKSPLRWAGGKRSLVPLLLVLLEFQKPTRLVDPFVGGGSVALSLPATSRILSDLNVELVNFYRQIRLDRISFWEEVKRYQDTAENFAILRQSSPETSRGQAVRFFILNRTAFMGLYRTNRLGHYNVPYGGGSRMNLGSLELQLSTLADTLQSAKISCCDFRSALGIVEKEDLIFLDPPYGHEASRVFNRYGESAFGMRDHIDLSAAASAARELGCSVYLTLPKDESILSLYTDWNMIAFRQTRAIPDGEILLSSLAHSERVAGSAYGSWQVL